MAFIYTMDVTTPSGQDDPAEADDRMREIKAALQERLNVEHVFDKDGDEVSGVNTGKHTDITCDSIVNAGNQSVAGNETIAGTLGVTGVATVGKGSLLASSDAPTTDPMIANKKFVDDKITANTTMVPAITGAGTGYAGEESITLPNGSIVKAGRVDTSIGATNPVAVSFATPFPAGIVSIQVTQIGTSALITYNEVVDNVTLDGFNIRGQVGGVYAPGFYWFAIGY